MILRGQTQTTVNYNIGANAVSETEKILRIAIQGTTTAGVNTTLAASNTLSHTIIDDDTVPYRNVASVKAGSISNNSCSLTSDGKLYCWGNNINGQLGDMTSLQQIFTPHYVPKIRQP